MIEIIIVIITQDAPSTFFSAPVVGGPAMKASSDHSCGDPREDHAPQDFDGTEPFLGRGACSNVRAVEFVDVVHPEFFPDVTLGGFHSCFIGEMWPRFDDFIV